MEKPVVIVAYSSDWERQFLEEQRVLKEIMGKKVMAIEHIGSTAVKGLGAKPIIDLMAGVGHLKEVNPFIEPLQKIGYEYVVHKEFPNRRFFRKGQWRAGTHHLHFYIYGSEDWTNQLLFRNFLRTHPDEREHYNRLKKELAEKFHWDRAAYTKAKESFIQNIIKKAKETGVKSSHCSKDGESQHWQE